MRARFERNLAAMAELQPELTCRLRELPVPESVEPAVGRDGSATFRIVGADGRRRWLGGSSMPTVSSPALLERFEPCGANVLVPTAGTGHELDLLCRATPAHSAVFAFESEPLNLKLLLHALDLVAWLRAGRLILLAFEPLESGLAAFLARHPGYDPPSRMLAHPGVSPEALEEARRGSESAMSAAIARQRESARELAAVLKQRVRRPLAEQPRVAIFSLDPRPRSMAAARGLTHALAELGWPAETLIPDSPWSGHTLTRLATIHAHAPDFLLLLNSCAGRLSEFIPDDLPVVSWFWPGAEITPATLDGRAPHHLLLAATPEQRDQLLAAAADAAHVDLLEAGVDTSVYRPVGLPAEQRAAFACDAAVVADADECAPAALGITLESHLRLWECLRQLIARHADRYHPANAPKLLAEAERASGVVLESSELRDRMTCLVRGPLARTVVTSATVAHLCGLGLRVKLWGRGWDAWPETASARAGPIPEPEQLNLVYQAVSSVVFPSPDAWTPLACLEVLASGGLPVVRAAGPANRPPHCEVTGALGSIPQYDRFKTLASLLRGAALPDKTTRLGIPAERNAQVAGQSLSARLRTIPGLLGRLGKS